MKRITRLTESDIHRIVKESVKRALKENNSPFIDSELALGNHDNAAFHRFNLILDDFSNNLIGWLKDEGYEERIDKYFMAKVMQAIRKVLSSYGLPSQ